jgi:hypothetical protein
MPVIPYNIYREQLTSLFHGHALWQPDGPDPTGVSVGDVGYVREGRFFRMFNVLLEWNDPSNYSLCEPEPYDPLVLGQHVSIRESEFPKGGHYSRHVTHFQETMDLLTEGPDKK